MHSLYFIAFISVASFINIVNCNDKAMKVISIDANIYGTSEVTPGETIAWSSHPDWSALGELLYGYGLMEIGLLCVKGAWLLYDKPMYEVNIDEKHNYKMLAGESTCEKPGKILSMQPFGSQGVIDESSFTYFHKPNFGSKAYSLTREWSLKDIQRESESNRKIESMITMGNDTWAITVQCGENPRTFCVSPNPVYGSDGFPICSLNTLEGTPLSGACNTLISVKMTCESSISETDTITISECRPFDVGNYGRMIKKPSAKVEAATPTPVEKPESRKVEQKPEGEEDVDITQFATCNADGTPSADLSDLLRSLEMRRDNNFNQDPMIVWTINNEDSYKSDLVDATFDIAIRVCPEDAVRASFLNIARELFMSELHESWKTTKSPEIDVSEMDFLLFSLRKCNVLLEEDNNAGELEKRTMAALARGTADSSKHDFEAHEMENMYKREKDDNLIFDITWLAANLVSTICHKTLHFTTNFWYQYVRTFQKTYLEPLASVWKGAKMSNKRLEFIMSGLGVMRQYDGMLKCTNEAIGSVPNMHPFRKPLPPPPNALT